MARLRRPRRLIPTLTTRPVNAPQLSDGVISLDQHTLANADAHLTGEDDEQGRRFGWYPARSTPETVRKAIEKWRADWAALGPTRTLAIRDLRTGVLAGGCQVRLRADQIAEMSYWVFPAHRGKGYATRAIVLTSDWVFGELGVERLELYVEPDNEASRGAARRAGFTEEGLLRAREQIGDERRDMVLYSCLPTDPPPTLG